jgi:16S rRNA (adenine1518-N6/adenine1519-N6)-dimethyltransferase
MQEERREAFCDRERFKNADVEVVQGDALKLLKPGYSKIVGNIPYYLTGRLLRIISEFPEKPVRSVFMVQAEVAERAMAVPPDMNRLAASIQLWAKPTIIARAPKEDFDPKPEVDSVVFSLERIRAPKAGDGAASRAFYAAVRTLFAQPRKTVLNNLAAHVEKSEAERLLRAQGIDPLMRPQDLSVESIARIGDNFKT